MRLGPIIVIAALAAAASAKAEPEIRITPSDVVEGEPVHVRVSGLAPGQTIRLHASRKWSAYPIGEEPYRGTASFTADARGVVDLRTSAPLPESSYPVADAAGLFWSMVPEKRRGGRQGGGPELTDLASVPAATVVIEAESAGTIVARGSARLRDAAEGVAVRDIREAGVTGLFARNGAAGRQAAVIVLGGSEGGLFTARWAAPIIASHGYATLGVGYFEGDEPDLIALPANLENIPLETLERARDWLARQPGVDASRIAVVGVSKGAELALVAASTFGWVTAAAAFAPSHVVWEGIPPSDQPDRAAGSSWTYRGKPLPFVRWSVAADARATATRAATRSSRLTEVHLESLAEFASDVPAARIPIERSRAALFVAAGTDDGMWPSAYSAERLRAALARRDARLPAIFELHPTGHQVMGSGWGPTTQFQRTTGRLQGGNARLDAQAQAIIWPAFLRFLDQHLRLDRHRPEQPAP